MRECTYVVWPFTTLDFDLCCPIRIELRSRTCSKMILGDSVLLRPFLGIHHVECTVLGVVLLSTRLLW